MERPPEGQEMLQRTRMPQGGYLPQPAAVAAKAKQQIGARAWAGQQKAAGGGLLSKKYE